jgi:hypothetical protein
MLQIEDNVDEILSFTNTKLIMMALLINLCWSRFIEYYDMEHTMKTTENAPINFKLQSQIFFSLQNVE